MTDISYPRPPPPPLLLCCVPRRRMLPTTNRLSSRVRTRMSDMMTLHTNVQPLCMTQTEPLYKTFARSTCRMLAGSGKIHILSAFVDILRCSLTRWLECLFFAPARWPECFPSALLACWSQCAHPSNSSSKTNSPRLSVEAESDER